MWREQCCTQALGSMANVVAIRESMEASGGSAETTGEPGEALGSSVEASGGLTEG